MFKPPHFEIWLALTLVAGLATQELPEVFGCVSMCVNSFLNGLDVCSSTTKLPLCLN